MGRSNVRPGLPRDPLASSSLVPCCSTLPPPSSSRRPPPPAVTRRPPPPPKVTRPLRPHPPPAGHPRPRRRLRRTAAHCHSHHRPHDLYIRRPPTHQTLTSTRCRRHRPARWRCRRPPLPTQPQLRHRLCSATAPSNSDKLVARRSDSDTDAQ
jgi:hypothetical protein